MLLADHTPSKECFALKQIALSCAEAIIRECETLVLLQASKYVITLLACSGCDDSERKDFPMAVYLLFPYVEKTLFKDYLTDISVVKFMAYSRALLKGLEYMHSYKFVHRDIAPDNVLFNRKTLTLKIVDVGIALPMHEIQGRRLSGGTYGYRAPELLFGASYIVDSL
jgi:cyclin-dependent kinase